MDPGARGKFMLFFTVSPTSSCCFCISLKVAVYIFAGADWISSITMLREAFTAASEGAWFNGDMTICAGPFAVAGIIGMCHRDPDKLYLYSVFNQIHAIALLTNASMYALVACSTDCAAALVGALLHGLIVWYFSFVVWSAWQELVAERIERAYGRETAELTPSGPAFVPVYSPPAQAPAKFMDT